MKTLLILLLSCASVFGQFNFTDLAFIGPVAASGPPPCTTYTVPSVTSLTVGLTYDPNGSYDDFGSSDTHTYTIYAKRLVGAVTIYSTTGATGTVNETGAGPVYYITLSWPAVADATGYVVIVDVDNFAVLPAYFEINSTATSTTIGNGIGTGWVDAPVNNSYTSGTPTLTPTSTCQ